MVDLPLRETADSPGGSESARRPIGVWRKAIGGGLAAAWQVRLPAAMLWLFGVGLVAGYRGFPPLSKGLAELVALREEWGWVFPVLSTALFGGLLPSLIPRWLRASGPRISAFDAAANTFFWGLKGVELDVLYRVQAALFGADPHGATVLMKTLVDQALYVPAFGLANVVLFRTWQTQRYAWRGAWTELRRSWYRRCVLPVLIPNWLVWIPAVALIYCLPVPLQLPIQNLVLCFWVLVLTLLTERDGTVLRAAASVDARSESSGPSAGTR